MEHIKQYIEMFKNVKACLLHESLTQSTVQYKLFNNIILLLENPY